MDVVDCWKEMFDIKSRCTTYHFFKKNGRRCELFATFLIFIIILSSLLWALPQEIGTLGLVYSYLYVVVSSSFFYILNACVQYRIGRIRYGKNKFTLKDAELYAKHEMFKHEFEKNEKLRGVSIDALLEWGGSRFIPLPTTEGTLTKLGLALLSVVVAFALGVEAVKEIMINLLGWFIDILPIILSLVFAFKHVFYPLDKRYANLFRNLKWIEIERKEEMTHFELNGGPRKPLMPKVD